MERRIIVVGAGVVGLSIAHDLAVAGARVHVVSDLATEDTVSAVSAALWFPYRTEPSALREELLDRSLRRFVELADLEGAGVDMRTGTVVERRRTADRAWTRHLSQPPRTVETGLPAGATAGLRVALPFVDMPTYLPWLRSQCDVRAVSFERRRVARLEDLAGDADLVVVACGLRSVELLGRDAAMMPVRGQIVRVTNPGLRDWITDDEHPDGLTYVFPRRHDVVVGGAAVERSWDLTYDHQAERSMLARACDLVPALRDQRVLGRHTGLRPWRSTPRIDWVRSDTISTIAAYGHGGAGVTLSWGTAERVAALALSRHPA